MSFSTPGPDQAPMTAWRLNGNYGVCAQAPGLEGRTYDLRALGECRAYIDSLQNEQFILPHLHILLELVVGTLPTGFGNQQVVETAKRPTEDEIE